VLDVEVEALEGAQFFEELSPDNEDHFIFHQARSFWGEGLDVQTWELERRNGGQNYT
jgi:hypothetical protein